MTFSTYFVNTEILQSLLTEDLQDALISAIMRFDPKNHATRMQREKTFNVVIQKLILETPIKTIQELIIDGELQEKAIIFFEGKTRFNGISEAIKNKEDINKRYVNFVAKVEGIDSDAELMGKFNVNHVTNDSAYANLQKSHDVSMIARVNSISGNQIDVRPIVIAERHEHPITQELNSSFRSFRYRVAPDEIFPNMISAEHSDFDINEMKSYSEDQIKKFFAEILHEGNVPKDWGGESSDLCSTKIMLNNKRFSGAFAFKGPSKFRKMTVGIMGKNGDQGIRLFEEPVDICFVQHCHYIDSNVIKLLEALAASRNKLYCVIDGNDTLRILKGYEKI